MFKKIISSLLVTLLSVCLTVPSVYAAGDEFATDGAIENEATQDQATQDETTQGAPTQDQVSQDAAVQPNETSRHFTHSVTKPIAVEDIDRVAEFFDAEIDVDFGEYSGKIGLDPENPFVITPVYKSNTTQIDKEYTFKNLTDNDFDAIPTTKTFEVRSDSAPDATQKVKLKLASAKFETAKTAKNALPTGFNAYCIYRGQESYLSVDYYNVTAQYSGDIKAPGVIETTITPVAAPLVQAIEDPENALNAGAMLAAILAAAGAGILFFYWLRSRRFKVCLKLDSGQLKIVARLGVRGDKEGLLIVVPSKIDLSNYAGEHIGILHQAYCKRGVPITIQQDGVILYQGDAVERIPLFNPQSYSQHAATLQNENPYMSLSAAA